MVMSREIPNVIDHTTPGYIPKVGHVIDYWFNHVATILEVKPYKGLYPQWFKWFVKLSAPNTRRGWLETCM